MAKDEIVLSNIVRMIKDKKVSNNERTLFDWLVFTQRGGIPTQRVQTTPEPKRDAMSDEELDDLAIRLFGKSMRSMHGTKNKKMRVWI